MLFYLLIKVVSFTQNISVVLYSAILHDCYDFMCVCVYVCVCVCVCVCL